MHSLQNWEDVVPEWSNGDDPIYRVLKLLQAKDLFCQEIQQGGIAIVQMGGDYCIAYGLWAVIMQNREQFVKQSQLKTDQLHHSVDLLGHAEIRLHQNSQASTQ